MLANKIVSQFSKGTTSKAATVLCTQKPSNQSFNISEAAPSNISGQTLSCSLLCHLNNCNNYIYHNNNNNNNQRNTKYERTFSSPPYLLPQHRQFHNSRHILTPTRFEGTWKAQAGAFQRYSKTRVDLVLNWNASNIDYSSPLKDQKLVTISVELMGLKDATYKKYAKRSIGDRVSGLSMGFTKEDIERILSFDTINKSIKEFQHPGESVSAKLGMEQGYLYVFLKSSPSSSSPSLSSSPSTDCMMTRICPSQVQLIHHLLRYILRSTTELALESLGSEFFRLKSQSPNRHIIYKEDMSSRSDDGMDVREKVHQQS